MQIWSKRETDNVVAISVGGQRRSLGLENIWAYIWRKGKSYPET